MKVASIGIPRENHICLGSDRSRKEEGKWAQNTAFFRWRTLRAGESENFTLLRAPGQDLVVTSIGIRLPRLPRELLLWDEGVWVTPF